MIYNFLLFLFIVLVDQITKILLLKNVGFGNSAELLPGVVRIFLAQNTGGAFSILSQVPTLFIVIGIVNLFIFSYLAFCPTVKLNMTVRLGCSCILGGTVGNLIDRIFKGGVIDFFDLEFMDFAVFNLADVFIDLGVILILIGWFFCRGRPMCLPKF